MHLVARAVSEWLTGQGYYTTIDRYEAPTYANLKVSTPVKGSVSLTFTATRILSDEHDHKVACHISPTLWAAQSQYLTKQGLPPRKPTCELMVDYEDPNLFDLLLAYLDYRFDTGVGVSI